MLKSLTFYKTYDNNLALIYEGYMYVALIYSFIISFSIPSDVTVKIQFKKVPNSWEID